MSAGAVLAAVLLCAAVIVLGFTVATADPVVPAVVGCHTDAECLEAHPDTVEPGEDVPCAEDDPCWSCETMGNLVCGEVAP